MNKPLQSDGTVGKALEVLDLVAEFGRPVRFTEILESSTRPKATLYRLLQTLTNQQMLSYDDNRQTYWLGLKLVRLAHLAWQQSSLAPIAAPYLDALAEKVGETVHLAQMESGQILFIDKKRRSPNFETLAQAGLIAPAHCTGVGKAILAFLSPARFERAMRHQSFVSYTPNTLKTRQALEAELEVIRSQGVAYDRQEHELGIISIAAPIPGEGQHPLGAVSIATSINRHNLSDLKAFRPDLLETVRSVGAEAAAWNFPQSG